MIRYIILAIVLYAFFVALYFLRERMLRQRKNSTEKTGFNPFRLSPKEDIIGKSKFDLCHSLPKATTLINNEKDIENDYTFANESKKRTPAVIPLDELDEVFSNHNLTDDSSDENEINIEIDNIPQLDSDNDFEELDEDEIEDKDTEGVAGSSIAQGVSFDDLADMIRTVDNETEASSDERQEAGRILIEMRQTDMFEQVVSNKPQKEVVVSTLMHEYFDAFYEKKRKAGEIDEPTFKAPKDFDIRDFA